MATNDLMSELQKDSIKLDDDSERKVKKTFTLLVLSVTQAVQPKPKSLISDYSVLMYFY